MRNHTLFKELRKRVQNQLEFKDTDFDNEELQEYLKMSQEDYEVRSTYDVCLDQKESLLLKALSFAKSALLVNGIGDKEALNKLQEKIDKKYDILWEENV